MSEVEWGMGKQAGKQRNGIKEKYRKTITYSRLSLIGKFFCSLWLIVSILCIPASAEAATNQSERLPLTLELLQERISSPILREGVTTVDLRNMTIDLRPENVPLQASFYQVLRKELQKSGAKPLGLDLSNSLIQGDFNGSELGLTTQLYAQSITPLLSPGEQEEVERLRNVCLQSISVNILNSRDCRSLLGTQSNSPNNISVFRGALILTGTRFNGGVEFGNTFFLQPVNADGAIFNQIANWKETRFSRGASFNNVLFRRQSQFNGSIFFDKVSFREGQFQEAVYFADSTFLDNANFNQSNFKQLAKFSRAQWLGNAIFCNTVFSGQAQFNKSNFQQFLMLSEVAFEQSVTFRESDFNQSVNLRGASILNQADFSDTDFTESAYLNVSGLTFNSNQAKILGNPGEIGKKLCVTALQGNQNVLRNLVQNFRQLQQIADANQVEYTKQRLHRREISHLLTGININTATPTKLVHLGFSLTQARAIATRRKIQPFRNSKELLALADIDLDTYNQISNRIVVGTPLSLGGRILQGWNWFALSLLLLLSGYGTNFGVVLGVGIIAIANFGVIFWLVDRFRRLLPVAIVPNSYETISTLTSFFFLNLFGLLFIFRNAEQPWLTLGCLLLIIIPIPSTLLLELYQQGRYHDLMDTSYFTEDGTLRQLRLLIGRLPVIPRYTSFRERYLPLLWERRWNWLNYYDFSLNNMMRLGFNDVRLRDEHLPAIVSTIAWYQWSLGILYITLLLWTLSRTIPGLNLLIYLK
uniref:pentapeptide repeat-containing protein n=2 Tax=Calothrix sp. 336/3 TaxID=1337936 RepID=UPI0030D701E8